MLGSEGERERECHLVGLPLVWDGHRVMGLPSEWDVWHIMGLPMARSCHRCGSAVILWACHHLPGQPSRCPAALQPHMTPQHCKHTAVLCAVVLRPLAFKDPPVFECCSDDGCCSFCSPSILELLLQKCQSGKCTLGV